MSHTDRLRRRPATFRRLTGITPAAFDRLLADLEPRSAAADTKRKAGAGRKHALPLADRLLMLLLYYRTYTTHAFLGFLFGVDDSAVGRNINPLQPLLTGIFRIPERKVRPDPEDLAELFFDATERPIPHVRLSCSREGRGTASPLHDLLCSKSNLSADEARRLEQDLMQLLGGPRSTASSPSLRNRIQGVAESNPDFLRLEFAADDDLLIEALRRAGILRR
jgi:hypothetical protein